ncbi:MAG: hypothetical protein JSU61_02285 [Fidelibacterota bacterium]|nr:MAG: hypothetical protein JSU61_02285 [Candidatus Neomarinimicrobiota bacterium]
MNHRSILEDGSLLQLPDFSDGEEFLGGLRGTLRRRQRRRAVITSLATTASAVLLFVFSYTSMQRQIDEELWETYLLSEMSTNEELTVDTEMLDEFDWELYLGSLLLEEDLDVLLEEILGLEEGEEWLQNISLKG